MSGRLNNVESIVRSTGSNWDFGEPRDSGQRLNGDNRSRARYQDRDAYADEDPAYNYDRDYVDEAEDTRSKSKATRPAQKGDKAATASFPSRGNTTAVPRNNVPSGKLTKTAPEPVRPLSQERAVGVGKNTVGSNKASSGSLGKKSKASNNSNRFIDSDNDANFVSNNKLGRRKPPLADDGDSEGEGNLDDDAAIVNGNDIVDTEGKKRPSFKEFLVNSGFQKGSKTGEPDVHLHYKAPDGTIATVTNVPVDPSLLISERDLAVDNRSGAEVPALKGAASQETLDASAPLSPSLRATPSLQNLPKSATNDRIMFKVIIIYCP